jgi:cell pole-organizing protein PopZ
MASSPQHEPTMEEILASIRKIISEDSTEAPAAEPTPVAPVVAAAPQPVAVPGPKLVEEDDDIMELTEEATPPPAPVAKAPEPEPAKPVVEDVVHQPIEEPVMAATPNSEIFSDKTRKAIDDTFSNLDVPAETPKAAPAPAVAASMAQGADGDTVEAVFERAVRGAVGPHVDQWLDGQKDALLAAMRPLIREWMDEHFPALLEGAVRDEVARVVKARGR